MVSALLESPFRILLLAFRQRRVAAHSPSAPQPGHGTGTARPSGDPTCPVRTGQKPTRLPRAPEVVVDISTVHAFGWSLCRQEETLSGSRRDAVVDPGKLYRKWSELWPASGTHTRGADAALWEGDPTP